MNYMHKLLFYYYTKRNPQKIGYLLPSINNWTLKKDIRFYTGKAPYSYNREYDLDCSDSQDKGLKEPINAFVFWHGLLTDKCLFAIKSFLATQHFNYLLKIYIDNKRDYEYALANQELQQILKKFSNVQLRLWDIKEEIVDTPFEKMKWFFSIEKRLSFIADDFRILALYKYGGFYFDMDTMFLRDISGFFEQDFCYCWEYQPYANSAIMYAEKDSSNMEYLVKKAVRIKSTQPWSLFNYEDRNLASMAVYPCYLFDPLWENVTKDVPFPVFSDFFRPFDAYFKKREDINSIKDFFPNSYAYEWHNRWGMPTCENSYYGIFNRELNKLLGLS